MTDTVPGRVARPMPGTPKSAYGYGMPNAKWYSVPQAITPTGYVAVTPAGVHPCDAYGTVADFVHCLYTRPAVTPSTPADALAYLGCAVIS